MSKAILRTFIFSSSVNYIFFSSRQNISCDSEESIFFSSLRSTVRVRNSARSDYRLDTSGDFYQPWPRLEKMQNSEQVTTETCTSRVNFMTQQHDVQFDWTLTIINLLSTNSIFGFYLKASSTRIERKTKSSEIRNCATTMKKGILNVRMPIIMVFNHGLWSQIGGKSWTPTR